MTEHNRTLLVMGVCCSTEEVVLRKRLDQAIGSEGYSFNPITSELKCRAHISAEALVSEVRAAGFDAREKKSMLKQEPFLRRHAIGLRTLGALMIGCAGGFLYENGAGDVGVGLLILSILVGGVATFRKAVLALRQGSLDMNTLMSVAVLGAMAIKRWEEGAAVIVLYSVSVMLEAYSTQRTRKAVASLMDVSPEEAFLMHETEEHRVPASSIRPGDHVLVKPGGRVPIDGVVIEGSSTVSEALLTGESAPVDKQTGSLVFAGCLNHGGALIVKAEKAFEETRLSHILHLIEEAQHKKAPVQTSVERFAAIYTKAVLGIALTVAVVPPLLFGGSVFVWLYRALVTIVIACPCALRRR